MPSQALLVNDTSVTGALERLMHSPELPYGTPAIVCSIPGAHEVAGALGVEGYLVKPVSRDALLGALDRLGLVGGTVLVVDDEPEALRLFWRMLASSDHAYRVLTASDGRQALGILREQRPDVVLLDLIMPQMDGFRFLEVTRSDRSLCDVPVIAISALDPVGHPIVSNAVAVVQKGGLSLSQLLACTEAITGSPLSPGRSGDPMPTGALPG